MVFRFMKEIEIVAGVIRHGSRILCVRRGYSELSYIAFKWEFPGGKIEANESASDALTREITEELRMQVVVGEKIMTLHHDYPDYLLTMHAYFCSSQHSTVTLTEHSDYEWCVPSMLGKFDWLEADIPLVEELSKMKC